MTQQQTLWSEQLFQHQAIKAISGISNYEPSSVARVAEAAQKAGVAGLDVAATPEVLTMARTMFSGCLFASSVEVERLENALQYGADALELGNYDALYDQGTYITAEDVLSKTRSLLGCAKGKALVSVTIPGHLPIEQQISLAKALESLGGVTMLQSEGALRRLDANPSATTAYLSPEQKAELSLKNTEALARAVRLPIMAASGFSSQNVAAAALAGASDVGLGSCISRLSSVEAMAQELTLARHAFCARPSVADRWAV